MKKRFSLSVILFLVMLFALATPAMAQTFPPLNGHLSDSTGLVDPARFETAVQPLVELSVIPIGIAYNNTQGLGNVGYDSAVLNNYGYGVPAVALPNFPGATPLDENVIAISIDYENRNIMVYVGDRFADKIGLQGISQISDEVAKYAVEDPTRAFEAGFAKAYDLMDPPFNRAVRGFVATFLSILPYLIGILLTVAALVWLIRQISHLSRANREIELVKDAMAKLNNAYDGAKQQHQSIVALLQNDYLEEAGQWTYSASRPAEQMNGLNTEFLRLKAVKLGLFSPISSMVSLVEAYRTLQADFEEVEDWIVLVSNENSKLQDQVAGAKDLLFRIEPEVERVAGWYEQARQYSRLLPLKKHVFGGLEAEVEAAKNLVLYQAHGELRGARILENVRVILEALEKAASIVVETEAMALATMAAIQNTLSPWASELPGIAQFCAVPLANLGFAISELTDDSDYTDVIAPANESKEGFEALRQEATKLADALTTRDAVAKSLKSFYDQGYRPEHVAKEVREAKGFLKDGLTAVTDGKWTKASNCLVQSKGSSEAALSRMTYLVKLQSTNKARLRDLSQKVAEVEQYRISKVAPLWNSLQTDFTPANWEAVIAGSFEIATHTLANLFDNPSDESDLASQVATLNSLEKQEFEKAEELLNDLFRQKEHAFSQLESVANRHALCIKARDTHQAVLAGAQTKLDAAMDYVAKHNPDIDKVVDDGLKAALSLIGGGHAASVERNFVLALSSADQAVEQVDQALDSAKGQVSELSSLRNALKSTKANATYEVEKIASGISKTHSSVVQERTEQALRAATSGLEQGQTGEAGLSALQDRKLASAISDAIDTYSSVERLARKAADSLASDMSEYDGLLKNASSAVEEAQAAISDAKTACGHPKAGSAGDGELSNAVSACPSRPSYGATRSNLQQFISSANSARSAAVSAAQKARSARRQKEEQEERERQEEAARQRAADKARQDALDSARRASMSSSSSTRIGGGSSSVSRNSGGISAGRKF